MLSFMKQPQGGKPAYIGGRVPEALRLRLLDASTLYGVPYIELLERSVKHYPTRSTTPRIAC